MKTPSALRSFGPAATSPRPRFARRGRRPEGPLCSPVLWTGGDLPQHNAFGVARGGKAVSPSEGGSGRRPVRSAIEGGNLLRTGRSQLPATSNSRPATQEAGSTTARQLGSSGASFSSDRRYVVMAVICSRVRGPPKSIE